MVGTNLNLGGQSQGLRCAGLARLDGLTRVTNIFPIDHKRNLNLRNGGRNLPAIDHFDNGDRFKYFSFLFL